MWTRILVGIGAYEAALIGLFQQQVVSDSMLRILEQFPIVGLVIFTLYYVQKQQREDNRQTREWLEKMLEIQRTSLKDVYNNQNNLMSTLLAQMDTKQNKMCDRVEILTQQLALNTSTVSEIAKVDSIVSDLIGRLEDK